jgi:protein-disulfide isomerase
MNSNNNIKILLIPFALFSIVGAYYIGYMSARLGLSAPFIPNTGSLNANNVPQEQPEMKLVEDVAPIELTGDEVYVGNKDSKMLLVTFTDFECPFCARFHPGLTELQKTTNSKLVYKHFPLGFHANAKNFANLFECVAKNSSFSNAGVFSDELFALNLNAQGRVTLDDGLNIARRFINDQTINNCKNDSSINSKIDSQYNQGIELGIQGTPALYIINTESGKAVRINGALDLNSLQVEFDKIK